ncbi:hypothetical protein HUG15_00395 [Salicibibacter cibarius]|uniref:DUF6792 domain-containing protein n=1 Tax=Salicibibacter cibarius TaxID=2743000 RepID=A0A7T6YZV2_9BACI|nr:DUF6792 domain-containing protein [Salicibibacter cibarius]QQK74228.1 hypothetical protein HUG15_00395 [Salicibibacter cibarius]
MGRGDQETLRIRLAELDYRIQNEDGLTDEDIIDEVKRIHVEETGRPLNEVGLFHMKKDQENHGYSTDANGTSFQLTLETEDGKRQEDIYVVSTGTLTDEDWWYNVLGIGVGSGGMNQALETDAFTKDALLYHGANEQTNVYGIGHSQAHNHLVNVQLNNQHFDDVYTYNGAQTNVYQLLQEDEDFEEEVRGKFNIFSQDRDVFRSINPDELEAFAKDYYGDHSDSIHHTRSTSDILYAIDHLPGSFELGNVEEVRTDSDHAGFSDAIASVLQEDLQALSDFLVPFGEAYKEDGSQGVIDMSVENALGFYLNLEDSNLDFTKAREASIVIVEELENANYLSETEARETARDLNVIFNTIENVYDHAIERRHEQDSDGFLDDINNFAENLFIDLFQGGGSYKIILERRLENLMDTFEGLGDTILEHHGLEALLNEQADDGMTYKDNELYLTGSDGSGNKIVLNLSATLDAYSSGMRLLDEQKE